VEAVAPSDQHGVAAPFDERDVTSILSGVFDINAKLEEIRGELRLIRLLMENGDDGEEEEEEEEDPGSFS
jgi:hypothetical protein